MVKQYQDRTIIFSAAFVLIALIIWLILMREFRLDDSFITYRYARNLTRGWGLVYNQNAPILSTTAPLYALLLALSSSLISDFHILGGLIGALCIGLGAGFMVALLPRKLSLSVRLWAGLLYVLSTPLWLALGMETALWLMLVLAAVWLTNHERYLLSGLLIGLAILVRPEAAIPGVLLGLIALANSVRHFRAQHRWWEPVTAFGIAALIPIAIYVIWSISVYGSPFPVTLAAKRAQAALGITGLGVGVSTWDGLRIVVENLLHQSPLYLMFAALALLGISRRLDLAALVLIGWGVLHLLGHIVLHVAPYRWYYVPLIPGLIALMAYGLQRILTLLKQSRPALITYAVAGVALLPITAQITSFSQIASYMDHGGERQPMLPIVDWGAYREAGEWLNANTSSDAVVGVAEVGQVGFYADRTMTDYLGLLQPDVAALLQRNDLYSWLVGYAPDYLVFQRFGGQVGLALYNYFIEYDPWFVANYQEVAKFDDPRYVLGPVVIYARTLPVDHALVTQPVDADYGPLQLTGIAADVQGDTARVRLDWRVDEYLLPADLHIGLAVLDAPAEIKFDGDYHTDNWPRALSTWHSLVLPTDIDPGDYPLWVSVGLINGEYLPHTVGLLPIPPP